MSAALRLLALGAAWCGLAGAASADGFDCVMDPSLTVRLAGSTGGIVESVSIERGSLVSAGDTVAELSSHVERATLRVLEMRAANHAVIHGQTARLDYLRGRLERARTLVERGVGTRDALEEVEAEVEASRNLLLQAETEQAIASEELERARIAVQGLVLRSPIDGIVVERARAVGEYLQPEAHVATIVRIDPLHVETYLPVTLYGTIREGDVARVFPAAPVEGDFEAVVTVIDRIFDVGSGTFGVRLTLENPGSLLPAGHRCKVRFDPGRQAD